MTLNEARKAAAVIARADNGCRHCASDLCEFMNDAFPDFVWSVVDDEGLEWHVHVEQVEGRGSSAAGGSDAAYSRSRGTGGKNWRKPTGDADTVPSRSSGPSADTFTAGDVVEIANLIRNQPRWISVKERLPEPHKAVLVYAGSSWMSVKHYVPNDGVHCWGWYPGGLPIENSTHWMPLPSPPR